MKEIGSANPPRNPPYDERTLRLETALRRSEKLALAGRLAASVMHEINNPSQAIADLVYLIGKEADRPELVRARAVQIEEQLVRIQYIARQTLSFFRDTPQIQAKDLVPLVETALRYHSALLEEKRIQVRKEMPDMLIGSVYPGDFLQLVSNLVRNAAEALPVGGVLCLRLRASGTNGRLTVADNGRGIPLRIRAGCLRPFKAIRPKQATGSAYGFARPSWRNTVGKFVGAVLRKAKVVGRPFRS